MVTIAVTRSGQRVYREDLIVRGHECGDDKAAVLLDADDHLVHVIIVTEMVGHECVQLTHAGERIEDPLSPEHLPLRVQDAHVVVGLSPIHSNKYHLVTSRSLTCV